MESMTALRLEELLTHFLCVTWSDGLRFDCSAADGGTDRSASLVGVGGPVRCRLFSPDGREFVACVCKGVARECLSLYLAANPVSPHSSEVSSL